MTQKTITKTQFAKLAGVNPSTVTRLCETQLRRAVQGKRIDAAHPDAVKYLHEKCEAKTPSPATGVDALYEAAVEACRGKGRYSASFLQRELKISFARASKILGMMRATGVAPEKSTVHIPYTEQAPEPQPAKKVPKAEAKKAEALTALVTQGETIHDIPDDIRMFADMTLRELIHRFGTDTAFNDWLKATKSIEDINEKRLKNAKSKGELVSREVVRVGVIDVFNSAHLKLMTDGAKSVAAGVISKHASGEELVDIENYVSDILGSFIKPVKNKIERALKHAEY